MQRLTAYFCLWTLVISMSSVAASKAEASIRPNRLPLSELWFEKCDAVSASSSTNNLASFYEGCLPNYSSYDRATIQELELHSLGLKSSYRRSIDCVEAKIENLYRQFTSIKTITRRELAKINAAILPSSQLARLAKTSRGSLSATQKFLSSNSWGPEEASTKVDEFSAIKLTGKQSDAYWQYYEDCDQWGVQLLIDVNLAKMTNQANQLEPTAESNITPNLDRPSISLVLFGRLISSHLDWTPVSGERSWSLRTSVSIEGLVRKFIDRIKNAEDQIIQMGRDHFFVH